MRTRLAVACVGLLRWISLACAAAWLVGQMAGDAWTWSQWIFWVPPVGVAAIALVAIACAAVLRPPRWRAIAAGPGLVAVMLLALGVWRLFGIGAAFGREARAVTLLQWNTHWPSGDDPRSMAFLASHPADLVVISNRGAITSPDMVRSWAGEDARVVGAGPFALVTRLPVVEARQVAVGGKGRQLWWVARFEVAPPEWGGRSLSIAMVDLPSRPTLAKSLVARGLCEACEEGGLGAVDLVAGDFNATDGSVIIRSCFAGFRDALAEAGSGLLATWPRRLPLWKIDHVLLGPGMRASAARTLDPGISDHRATLVELACPGG